VLFQTKGDLEQANKYLIKCLEIMKAFLPRNDPDLAKFTTTLAGYFKQKEIWNKL
jgi:hypothetical protein